MDVVQDPLRRQRYVFVEHGDVLEIQIEVDPGGEVPPHLHPVASERFEVLEGEVTFEVGRDKLVARASRRWTGSCARRTCCWPAGRSCCWVTA